MRDITGIKFGNLTAINPTSERKSKNIVWRCLCDCGNYKNVPLPYLLKGEISSCGCLNNLTDKRFGRLVVVNKTNKRASNGSVIWECECDCGGIVFVRTDNLISGHTKSCGCLPNNEDEY